MTKGKKIKSKEDYADKNLIERVIGLELKIHILEEDVKELKNKVKPLFSISW